MDEYNNNYQNNAPLRYCTQCGSPIYDENVGCPNCAAQQQQTYNSQPYAQPVEQYAPQPVEQYAPQPAAPYSQQPMNSAPFTQNNKPNMLVVLILSAAAVGLFLLARLFNISSVFDVFGNLREWYDWLNFNSAVNGVCSAVLFYLAGLFMILFVAVQYKKQPMKTKFATLAFLFLGIQAAIEATELPVTLVLFGVNNVEFTIEWTWIATTLIDLAKAVLFIMVSIKIAKGNYNKIVTFVAAGTFAFGVLFSIVVGTMYNYYSYINIMFYLANATFAAALILFAVLFRPESANVNDASYAAPANVDVSYAGTAYEQPPVYPGN